MSSRLLKHLSRVLPNRLLKREGVLYFSHTARRSSFEAKLEKYFGGLKLEEEKKIRILKESMRTVYLRKTPLISFDVEAYERSLEKVTEIGISVYDPQILSDSILPMIKNIHLIIKENIRLNNHRFCPNNKDRFMGGESYVVGKTNAAHIMSQIIREYVGNRNGAFVGHHIEGDIKWLKSLNIEVPDNVKTVDTHKLYTISRSRGGTLRGVLRLLEIPHGFLHNAGNDAYFTLLASMALCDPDVRVSKGLDTFYDVVKKTKAQLEKEKFSDVAHLKTNTKTNDIINSVINPTIEIPATVPVIIEDTEQIIGTSNIKTNQFI